MADDYLGRKMEDYRARAAAPAVQRPHVTLGRLLAKNRSCRGYDAAFTVREDQLRSIIEVNTMVASTRNRQSLRFRPVLSDEAAKILPYIHMGGALPELHLPLAGQEPNAYIVVCSTVAEEFNLGIDIGIAAQSMLLRAVEMGLGGLCIGSFDRNAIRDVLALPLPPVLVMAFGRSAEHVETVEVGAGDALAYYRRDGVHYVPKIRVEDLIIGR